MFTFNICKSLGRQMSWSLISKNISFMSIPLRCQCESEYLGLKKENDFDLKPKDSNVLLEDVMLASKLIHMHDNTKAVKWEEILKKLKDSNVQNPHSTLLQCVSKQNNADYGVEYYNHLVKEGKEFTAIELIRFLKLFYCRKDLILKNETIIKFVYESIKSHLISSPAIQNFVLGVIAEVPYCFNDYVKTFSNEISESGNLVLAVKAFEMNRPDIAIKIMNGFRYFIPSKFAEAYLEYLMRMAEENKLLPYMINTMINFYEKNVTTIDSENIFLCLKKICQTANKHKNRNFTWSVSNCIVCNLGVCSKCQSKLKHKGVSQSEFSEMKKDILSQIGLFDQSVFISTSNIELKEFLLFLKQCKPYDVVIDSLNIIYRLKPDGFANLFRLIKHLIDEGLRILVVGKKHARNKIMKAPFLKKQSAQEKIQFFFTSNLSDDDVFILYATLNGGLGTHLVTHDNLSSYVARLKTEQKDIFLRWKIYHQYNFTVSDLIPPRRHLGLSQLTKTPVNNCKNYIWHISYSPGISKLNVNTPLKWVCLQAKPEQEKDKLEDK